jgi:ubiquinone/menaquinone biosynthesis C-methylase UbiE
VPAFLGGRCTLLPIEVAEMGEVEGLRLLHLQCHFGLDTLSWARRGAKVTGLDFSSAAIEAARELAEEAGIEARFVQSEVTRAPEALGGERFDRVFTSWGVLGWLPDLAAWARAVEACIEPGGAFYIVEIHPTAWLFEGPVSGGPRRAYPYFREETPLVEDTEGSYAQRDAEVRNRRNYSWIFELSRVVQVLLDVGLRLEFLHEHDANCNDIFEGMVRGEDGLYRLPEGSLSLPLSFSLMARKES